ncbi:CHAT domain-containing protein [Cellulomonas sp. P5_C5]
MARVAGPALYELGWWHHVRSRRVDGSRDEEEFVAALVKFTDVRILSDDTMPISALPDEVAACARGELADGTWQMDAWLGVESARLGLAVERHDRVDELRELVSVERRRLGASPAAGDERSGLVVSLALALRKLGVRTADAAALGEAAELLEEALRERHEPVHEGALRSNLANVLRDTFDVTGDPALPAEAWRSACLGLELAGDSDNRFAAAIAVALTGLQLFHVSEDREVLDSAIEKATAALDGSSPGAAGVGTLATTLAQLLQWKYQQAGRPTDLDRRVALGRSAVESARGAKESVYAHAALAETLVDRYWAFDDPADLDEAVVSQERAVALLDADDPAQHEVRANFAGLLRTVGEARSSRPDLDRAVDEVRAALTFCAPDDPGRPRTLEIAATTLEVRYRLFHDRPDLDEAIAAARDAARATGSADPELARRYGHLLVVLEHRFRLEPHPDLVALDELVVVGQSAVDACQATATEYVGHAVSAARFYELRFDLVGDGDDARRAWRLYDEAGAHPLGRAAVRYDAAVAGARLAERLGDADAAYAGYRRASRLLADLAWRGVTLPRRVQALEGHGWVVAAAAELALEAGRVEDALDVLEENREQIWQQDSELAADLSALREADPGLAAEVEAARDRLTAVERAPEGQAGALDARGAPRRAAVAEWEGLLSRARALPGLQNLLRRPEVADLRRAVGSRTVVLVVPGRRHGFAIVLQGESLRAIRLPRATRAAAEEIATGAREALARLVDDPADLEQVGVEVRRVLEWCWVSVVAPVLRALDWIDEPGPADELAARRVWWCPTGALVSMPLHAAQSSGEGTAGVVSALDRCVSSFTGSLRGLADAVRRGADLGPVSQVSLVGSADGLADYPLAHVRDELDAVASQVPAPERHDDPSPTVAEVLDLIARSSALHLACHARNQDGSVPAALLLRDGAVELPMLGAYRPRDAAWAFISACGTAETELGVADEHLTLAAGFQAAGYPYVVGTLWSIVDQVAAEVAREVYRQIRRPDGLDLARSAAAINTVTGRLRSDFAEFAFLWAAHVHYGPD